MLGNALGGVLRGIAHGDAHYLQTFRAVTVQQFLQVGNLLDAPGTPAGPEIDESVFAGFHQRGEVRGLSLGVLSLDVGVGHAGTCGHAGGDALLQHLDVLAVAPRFGHLVQHILCDDRVGETQCLLAEKEAYAGIPVRPVQVYVGLAVQVQIVQGVNGVEHVGHFVV